MITYFKEFNLLKESISFQDDSIDYHHEQEDRKIVMYKDNIEVAFAEYCIFKRKVYINIIESIVKGKGYGIELMKELASKYGYENLERSSLTPDGVKMRAKLDKFYNFSLEKELKKNSKQYNKEILNNIKDSKIKTFLEFAYEKGIRKAFNKFGNELRELKYFDKYDFNEFSDFLSWIEGSFEDSKNYDDEVPENVEELYNKLKI